MRLQKEKKRAKFDLYDILSRTKEKIAEDQNYCSQPWFEESVEKAKNQLKILAESSGNSEFVDAIAGLPADDPQSWDDLEQQFLRNGDNSAAVREGLILEQLMTGRDIAGQLAMVSGMMPAQPSLAAKSLLKQARSGYGKDVVKAYAGKSAAGKGAPKPSPPFEPPTNPPQMPPKDIPPGW